MFRRWRCRMKGCENARYLGALCVWCASRNNTNPWKG